MKEERKKKISLSTENVPNPFKVGKLLFSNIVNVLAYFSPSFGKSQVLWFHSFSSPLTSSEEKGFWNMTQEQKVNRKHRKREKGKISG